MKYATAFTAAISLATVKTSFGSPLQNRDNVTTVYDFSDLTASPELSWTPCFGDRKLDLQCALLEVPLDYSNRSVGTTAIAFLKKPSKNPLAEDILLNPGGPGGSGVDLLLSGYDALERKLGTNHNLIGFDPRGVNNSGPDVSCFPSDPTGISQNLFFDDVFSLVDVNNEYEVSQGFQRSGAFGDWCSAVHAVNGNAKYANTVAVAQDMLNYIELRAKQLGKAPAKAKLWYYGISYGTILGATYASLYPDRIERMILDGVLDTEDHYKNGWRGSVADSDAVARTFFQYCFEAGPQRCVFHKNSSSAEAIEKRYLAIIDSLKKSPVQVTDLSIGAPATATWQSLSSTFFGLIYFPVAYFPYLAEQFASIEQGNYTALASLDAVNTALVPSSYDSREVRSQVACFDSAGRYNTSTLGAYKEHLAFMNKESFYGGPFVSAIVGPACRNMRVFPPASQFFSGIASANKTSAPILFVSTRLDPITPLRMAKKMSSQFAGSALLTADTVGHSTFGVMSNCTDSYLQAYIADATQLPPKDTLCKTEQVPFFAKSSAQGVAKRWAPF